MEMHKLNPKLEEVPCGQVSLKQAIAELDVIAANGDTKYKDAEEAISATWFTVSRSQKDFLRVECHSKDEFHFSSDRLVYNCSWLKKLFSNPYMQFRVPIEKAASVLSDYFNFPREKFEEKYAITYTHRESLEYVEISE